MGDIDRETPVHIVAQGRSKIGIGSDAETLGRRIHALDTRCDVWRGLLPRPYETRPGEPRYGAPDGRVADDPVGSTARMQRKGSDDVRQSINGSEA